MIKFKTYLSAQEFKTLVHTIDFYCVSIYCPVHTGVEVSKNNLLLLIDRVKKIGIEKGLHGSETQNIIEPLVRIAKDKETWEETDFTTAKTFVIFSNTNKIHTYFIEEHLQSYVHVTSNYYLLPLFEKATQEQLAQDSLRIKQVVLDEASTTNRLEKIIPLAFESKIAVLYVSSKNGVYGVYDPINKTTMIDNAPNNKNMSLINLAAITTHQYGGKVYLVDPMAMPTKGVTIQAILK